MIISAVAPRNRGVAAVLLGLASVGGPATAQAGIDVCNETGLRQSVAIGYEAPDGQWTSEGWWVIAPGQCKTVMGRPLDRNVFYYRATVRGGFFDGPYAFCTQTEVFTIVGDEDCEERGYERTRFREVRTERAERFTLTLLPEEGSGRAPRASAGDEPGPPDVREIAAPFTRGQLGEPFTQRGIFVGCEIVDGLDVCAFEVEGWRYHAYAGDGTPAAVTDALYTWPMPLAVELSGDMVSHGDITVEVALARVTEVPEGDPFARERRALQGEWRSTDDPASSFRIVGADVYDYHGGQWTGHHWMTLTGAGCDGFAGGIGLMRTDLETRDAWCVFLGSVDDRRLELVNPGRGNILTYLRVD